MSTRRCPEQIGGTGQPGRQFAKLIVIATPKASDTVTEPIVPLAPKCVGKAALPDSRRGPTSQGSATSLRFLSYGILRDCRQQRRMGDRNIVARRPRVVARSKRKSVHAGLEGPKRGVKSIARRRGAGRSSANVLPQPVSSV